MQNVSDIEAVEQDASYRNIQHLARKASGGDKAKERRIENLLRLAMAARHGDMQEIDRLFPMVQLEACSLKAAKMLFGAEFIREKKLDTTKADLEFGPGWLDRQEEV